MYKPDFQTNPIMSEDTHSKLNHHALTEQQVKVTPTLAPEGLYGPIGEASKIVCDGFEAHPEAVFLSLMTHLTCSIHADNVTLKVGSRKTPLRCNALLIGDTGSGKGVAQDRAEYVMNMVKECIPEDEQHSHPLIARDHQGGLSTTEGIAYELRDTTDEDGDQTANDKRLYLVDEEFVSTIIKCRVSGSTLSSTLRNLFSGKTISPLIKYNRVTCTSPRVCITGHITPKEFMKEIGESNLHNGFCNRFITILLMPMAPIPFPTEHDHQALTKVTKKIAEAIHWTNTEPKVLEMSECFKNEWKTKIYELACLAPKGSLEQALMSRSAQYTLILSTFFAVMDKEEKVREQHLNAALAWIDYWHQSIRYLFDTEKEVAINEQREARAELVLNSIKQVALENNSNSFKRSLLTRKIGKRVSSAEANDALKLLQERHTPAIKLEKTGSKNCQIITLLV
ncbi:DUF3987 domain-containing protein [Vibrio astriarenae]